MILVAALGLVLAAELVVIELAEPVVAAAADVAVEADFVNDFHCAVVIELSMLRE